MTDERLTAVLLQDSRQAWSRVSYDIMQKGKLTFWHGIYRNSPEAFLNYFEDDELGQAGTHGG